MTTTAREQEATTAARLQLEARDREIAELRAAVARHERANGRLVAELELAREVVRDLSAKVYASKRLAMQKHVAFGVGSRIEAVPSGCHSSYTGVVTSIDGNDVRYKDDNDGYEWATTPGMIVRVLP